MLVIGLVEMLNFLRKMATLGGLNLIFFSGLGAPRCVMDASLPTEANFGKFWLKGNGQHIKFRTNFARNFAKRKNGQHSNFRKEFRESRV